MKTSIQEFRNTTYTMQYAAQLYVTIEPGSFHCTSTHECKGYSILIICWHILLPQCRKDARSVEHYKKPIASYSKCERTLWQHAVQRQCVNIFSIIVCNTHKNPGSNNLANQTGVSRQVTRTTWQCNLQLSYTTSPT